MQHVKNERQGSKGRRILCRCSKWKHRLRLRRFLRFVTRRVKQSSKPSLVRGWGKGGWMCGDGLFCAMKLIRVFLRLTQGRLWGLKTGKTPVNCLIRWVFLRSRLEQMCFFVYTKTSMCCGWYVHLMRHCCISIRFAFLEIKVTLHRWGIVMFYFPRCMFFVFKQIIIFRHRHGDGWLLIFIKERHEWRCEWVYAVCLKAVPGLFWDSLCMITTSEDISMLWCLSKNLEQKY